MRPRARAIWCSRRTVTELRDSRRWQLRRPVAVPAGYRIDGAVEKEQGERGRLEPVVLCSKRSSGQPSTLQCPFGRRDDWLWVREQYRLEGPRVARRVVYEADELEPSSKRWLSALLMPRSAARFWLRVYNVRAQQLQSLSAFDISSEGVECPAHDTAESYCQSECQIRRAAFAERWDERYGNSPARWAANPWVWAASVIRYSPQMAVQALAQDARAEAGEPPRRRSSVAVLQRSAARR